MPLPSGSNCPSSLQKQIRLPFLYRPIQPSTAMLFSLHLPSPHLETWKKRDMIQRLYSNIMSVGFRNMYTACQLHYSNKSFESVHSLLFPWRFFSFITILGAQSRLESNIKDSMFPSEPSSSTRIHTNASDQTSLSTQLLSH